MRVFKFIYLFFTFFSCAQSKDNSFVVDASIKEVVERKIENIDEFKKSKMFQIYASPFIGQFYLNDSLVLDTKSEEMKQLSKSFYFWDNDILNIDGGFGIFGTIGFCIKIKDDKAQVFHMLSSDDFPTYAYKENDSLIMRLEVQCKNTKIILSEIPNLKDRQIIYGYVEFESENYYSVSGIIEENEEPVREKNRNKMKIYFKSGYLDLKNKK